MSELGSHYEVFLFYDIEDEETVEKIAVYLKNQAKLHPWFKQWKRKANESDLEHLERGLAACPICAIFVGSSGKAPWCKRETETSMMKYLKQKNVRLIPILLPGAPDDSQRHALSGNYTWVDLRKGIEDEYALWLLESEIRGRSPGMHSPNEVGKALAPQRFEGPRHGEPSLPPTDKSVYVFISYKRQEPDSILGRTFADVLRKEGYVVFFDVDIPIGTYWANCIQQFLEKADFFLLLLSRGAANSKMVREEFFRADAISEERNGKPIFLPVRIRMPDLKKVPYDISAHLRDIQQESWEDEKDTERVVENVLKTIRLGISLQAPPPSPLKGAESRKTLKCSKKSPQVKSFLLSAAIMALMFVLAWKFQIQPFNPDFPQIKDIVKYTANSSVEIQLPLDKTNLSRVALKHPDGSEEILFNADSLFAPPKRKSIRHTLSNLPVGEHHHSLTLTAGLPEKTHTIPLRVVYYPKWEIRQIPDKRLERLNPIVDVHGHEILFRNVMNGMELGALKDLQSPITAWIMSPDRRQLLVGRENGRIRLWNVTLVETGGIELMKVEIDLLKELPVLGVAVISLGFTPDGLILIAGCRNHTLKIFGVQKGEILSTFRGHAGAVTAVASSSNAQTVFSGSGDKTIKQWDMRTEQVIRTLKGHAGPVTALAASRDGKILISGSVDRTLKIWDLQTIENVKTLGGHSGAVNLVAFSPDGSLILSTDESGALGLWNTVDWRHLKWFQAFENQIGTAGFSKTGSLLFAQSRESDLKVWETATGREVQVYIGHRDSILGIAFSPDYKRMSTSGADSALRIWDLKTGDLVSICQHPGAAEIWGSVFSSDGKTIVSVAVDKFNPGNHPIRLFNPENGRELHTIPVNGDSVYDLALSEDGNLLASAGLDEGAKLWDIATWQRLFSFKNHAKSVSTVAFSPDGNTLISGGRDNKLKLWDVQTGEELRAFRGHKDWILDVAFSPDGSMVISSDHNGDLILWDVMTARKINTFSGHKKSVFGVSFSPDGKTVISASDDGTLKLWDAASGHVLRNFVGHNAEVRDVVFFPDGKRAASVGFDGAIKIWWTGVEPK